MEKVAWVIHARTFLVRMFWAHEPIEKICNYALATCFNFTSPKNTILILIIWYDMRVVLSSYILLYLWLTSSEPDIISLVFPILTETERLAACIWCTYTTRSCYQCIQGAFTIYGCEWGGAVSFDRESEDYFIYAQFLVLLWKRGYILLTNTIREVWTFHKKNQGWILYVEVKSSTPPHSEILKTCYIQSIKYILSHIRCVLYLIIYIREYI